MYMCINVYIYIYMYYINKDRHRLVRLVCTYICIYYIHTKFERWWAVHFTILFVMLKTLMANNLVICHISLNIDKC